VVPVERRQALRGVLEGALPAVYDYVLHRCRDRSLAEDLTSESYLAAALAIRERGVEPTTAWLIGIARHKLADHWRQQAREERRLAAVGDSSRHRM
jgi:RNA polymerase sigma-70 factor (ECF subfamily)